MTGDLRDDRVDITELDRVHQSADEDGVGDALMPELFADTQFAPSMHDCHPCGGAGAARRPVDATDEAVRFVPARFSCRHRHGVTPMILRPPGRARQLRDRDAGEAGIGRVVNPVLLTRRERQHLTELDDVAPLIGGQLKAELLGQPVVDGPQDVEKGTVDAVWLVGVGRGAGVTPFVAVVLALGLNEGAYMSEIVRGGTAPRSTRPWSRSSRTERTPRSWPSGA